MIRQLDYRCWHFDCGVWEEPHFPTEAAAVAADTASAGAAQRDPRPVQQRPAPCWVAECDRCECPAGDENDWGTPGHYADREPLLTTLEIDGWLLGAAGWVCCADCSAAGSPGAEIKRVPAIIDWAGSRREVVGEVTACPDLVIMAGRSAAPEAAGVWLGLRLVHRPTGRYLPLPGSFGEPIGVLHRIAQLLTDLDWSCPEVEHYAAGYTRATVAAYEQASDEYLSRLYPAARGELR